MNNQYVAFYRGKRYEVNAKTSYAAQMEAAAHFKAKKSWEVAIVPVAINGEQVSLSTAQFG